MHLPPARHGVIVYRTIVPVSALIGGAVLDFWEPVHDYAQARPLTGALCAHHLAIMMLQAEGYNCLGSALHSCTAALLLLARVYLNPGQKHLLQQ